MSRKEREEEIIRLMSAIEGDVTELMIDEAGKVSSVPEDTTEQRSCTLCHAYLDDDEPVIEGHDVCEDCAPELQELMTRQVVCLICDGKCLIFHGPGQGWHPCEMCHGSGWIDGIVARWNDVI